jgi:uncharacterized protein with FMN-binding domain
MRLLIALAGTAAGLAALLSFKTHGSAAGTEAAQGTGAQAGGTSAAVGGAGSVGTASSGSGTASASPMPRQSTAGSAGAAGKTVTGAADNTSYGPMQVQVTLQGRKITGVKVVQQTNTGTESQQIDANAIPQLNRETLAAQSARIDAVSGASYTSAGYIKSLQSALDQAKA